MIYYLDYLLDRITMYRVVLYYLIIILVTALGLSGAGLLPYTPLGILASTAILLIVCGLTNYVFSKVYNAPTNGESAYISALILVCILSPLRSVHDLPLLLWAGVLAMASKYILALRNKHIFNPVAIAVVLTAFVLNQSAVWWVGTPLMAPIIVVGGLLMIRKLRRYAMLLSFFITTLITSILFTLFSGGDSLQTLQAILLNSPLFFFAFVMFTEPLTSPPTQSLQIAFGILVGFLNAPQVHLFSFYFTPELALVIGNVFSYIVSPKIKERLTLIKSTPLTPDVVEFEFKPDRPFSFTPGQYMEFTLPHSPADSRGTRRYFTLASSPTEPTIKLGIKRYPHSSSFKKNLFNLAVNETLMTGQLAGEFTLPKDPQQKLAFIAGGIGITPFRSMIKYLMDTNQSRAITLLYSNRTAEECAYRELFDQAKAKIGTQTVYTITEPAPASWQNRTGRINKQMIQAEIPDYKERLFYISGPYFMVSALEKTLRALGVKSEKIKKDFFPGLA